MTKGTTLSLKTQVGKAPIIGLHFSVSFIVDDNEEGKLQGRQESKEDVVDNFWEEWQDWQEWKNQKNKKNQEDKKDREDQKDREDPEDWEEGSAFADQFPTDSLTQNS